MRMPIEPRVSRDAPTNYPGYGGGWPTELDAAQPLFKVGERFGFWDGVFRTLGIELVLLAVFVLGRWLA
jgi:hypothetical protein